VNKSDTTTVAGIVATLSPLVGQDIVVSGPGGTRYEHVDEVGRQAGVPYVLATRCGAVAPVAMVGNGLLIAYGGFVVRVA
jgi:hypothetical protein